VVILIKIKCKITRVGAPHYKWKSFASQDENFDGQAENF